MPGTPRRSCLRFPLLGMLAFAGAFSLGQIAFAQRLFSDSISGLPQTVTHIKYANLKALRDMPHFASLQKSYLDNSVTDLQRWLGGVGLSEVDVAEVLLGREVRNGGGHVFAIASGRFEAASPDSGRPESRFSTVKIGDLAGYCEGRSSDLQECAVFKGMNWAAVGRREFLTHIAEVGGEVTDPLSADTKFTDLASTIPRDTPLWGIVLGSEAISWFNANIPFSESVPILWKALFEGLDGLAYCVTPGDGRVSVIITFEYENPSAASALGAVLQGVKALEGIFWKTEHPGVSDPFVDAEVTVEDRKVTLALSPSYQALESGVVLGTAH